MKYVTPIVLIAIIVVGGAMVIRNTFLIHDVSNALTTKLHDQASLQVDPKVVVTLSKSELVKPVSQSDSWRWKGEGVIRITR